MSSRPARILNAILLTLVAAGYDLWFDVTLAIAPLAWLWRKFKRPC